MQTLNIGIYRIPADCTASLRNGEITVRLRKDASKKEIMRCRNCLHFARGKATYGGWPNSPICTLHPKTYAYDSEKKSGGIFFSTRPSRKACPQFTPQTLRKMMTETIYHPSDLHSGECEWCGEKSNELIYTEDGQEVCVDCFEEKEFYNHTMKGI